MKQRIVTGVLLALVVFGFLLVASDYIFGVGVFLVAILGAYEWIRLAGVSNNEDIIKYLAIYGVLAILVAALFKYIQFIFPVFWLYGVYKLYQYEKEKIEKLTSLEILIFGAFALTPFAASLYVLHSNGIAWVFLFILIIAAADSGAYFVGKSMGKTLLLPRLSPKKTIEGLIGGLILAIIVSIVFLLFMDLGFLKYLLMIIVCGVVSIVSVIGDVFESMIKRVAGVKDSGDILPGHGGILDRIDGYLPTLPLFVFLGYVVGVLNF
ncbi:phosphatidate cytidylyltransferase [Pseudofrancisella aestuarii]|uniref:Phosphatidate cytidylyltransferase n=1 Tax=Pseudofrancisella aestuarii TaxID=2670347 RepID=A0ABV9TBB8_9GAMM|nr:phosphatidate cytidylyltransferase [Pseudofrancisella aestuarii]